ncbi:hypothetical protein ABT173_49030 [Streptomyces sp. NPDC001795]|uniref:hypothetical protein n=1 Tax=unclassified Streptomyces TaxID=2593676 RepID=UPI00331BFB9F
MARTAGTTQEREAARTEIHEYEGAGLHLHTRTLHPPVPIPYLTRSDVTSTAKAATALLPGRPPAKDLVFYGGLGALAVAGALEWPVALAVGGATWLVRSTRARGGGTEASAEHNGEARGATGKNA